jgi:hypothetical protein
VRKLLNLCLKLSINSLYISDEEGVPLGLPLIETDLFLFKNEKFISLKELDSSCKHLGSLYLSSKTRKCLLNNEIKDYIYTGDEVLYYNNKLYHKGRTDKTRKINGKLLNINLLQKVSSFYFKILYTRIKYTLTI